LKDQSLLLDSSDMAKIQSFLIPTFTVSLTLAALICPWALPARQTPLPPLYLEAALASAAAIAIVMLGAVRRRDLVRIGNARAVLDGLGRRPLPAGRLIALAGWSLTTLYDELAWGHTLNACALLIRLATRLGAGLVGLAALAMAVTPLLPALPGLPAATPATDWTSWLAAGAAVPLWLLAELSLARRDGAAAPTPAQIRAALTGLGDRLGGTGTQLGLAAMTGVEQGLDTMLPLIEQRIMEIARRPPAAGPARTERPRDSDGDELVEEVMH
jgi:hypothetical protein